MNFSLKVPLPQLEQQNARLAPGFTLFLATFSYTNRVFWRYFIAFCLKFPILYLNESVLPVKQVWTDHEQIMILRHEQNHAWPGFEFQRCQIVSLFLATFSCTNRVFWRDFIAFCLKFEFEYLQGSVYLSSRYWSCLVQWTDCDSATLTR